MPTRIGEIITSTSARGNRTYSIELWHDGLKKHRLIRDGNCDVLRRKVDLQSSDWNDRWGAVVAQQQSISDRNAGKRRQDERKAMASERTAAAQKEFELLANILRHTLDIDDTIDWERLKDNSPFPEPRPRQPKLPTAPSPPVIQREPKPSDAVYTPAFGFLDQLFASRRDKKLSEKRALYESDYVAWATAKRGSEEAHISATQFHQAEVEQITSGHSAQLRKWEQRKTAFLIEQSAGNAAIDEKRRSYFAMIPEAILEYCDLVLASSEYPTYFPKEFDLDYDAASKTLIVDYALPAPEHLPRIKAVRYVATKDDFEEQYISESQSLKLFDDTIYQVVLRTVHELFEADSVHSLQTVVFNGIVTAIDRSKGTECSTCIVSLRANREEFLAIHLAMVDPRTCFKSLKGVGSSKLSGLSPIAPIMQLRREDARFVSAYQVADSLDGSVNLAAMDWEDFEHLIREIFEKEFSSTGGEVRVTQASRDGGVDAIAFDPDPIRGGKIVIQAKRYTNTVGVGAVRDLYGTVVNEGATKGVLVTTSDFGPDSYSFANGKPLVLLSGANLLHMLEKHGHSARINISEAKKLANSGK